MTPTSNVIYFPSSSRGMGLRDHQQALAVTYRVPGWAADLVDDEEGGAWIALEPSGGQGVAAFAVLRADGRVVLHRLRDDAAWSFGSVEEAVMAGLGGGPELSR